MPITEIQPTVDMNGRYSVKRTSELLGVSCETLRRYNLKGAIKCGLRRKSTRKFYLGSEIIRFWKAQG